MGRNNALKSFKCIADQQMSEDIVGAPTNITYLDNINFQALWTGFPIGTLKVEGSINYDSFHNTGDWEDMGLGSPSITGAGDGSAMFAIPATGVPWVRLKWTANIGSNGELNITTVADVAKSLAGKYFLIQAAPDGNKYAPWFKVSGTGSAPSVAGYTPLEVDISTNDTAADVSTALATALAAVASGGDFGATALGAGVTDVTMAQNGPFAPPADVDTGFTIAIVSGGGTLNAWISGKKV